MKNKPLLSFWQIFNMTFGFLGIQFGFALQNANASSILMMYGANVEHLSYFWLAAPLTGSIIQPIIGYYSDKTWCRMGRRKPFFLLGGILTAIALILMPNAGVLLPKETAHLILSPIIIGAGMLMMMDASINIAMQPFRALVGDMLPEKQHTTGFAVQTFLIGIGAVVGSFLPSILGNVFGMGTSAAEGEVPDNIKYGFYIGAIILMASLLWTIVKTKEYNPEQMRAFQGKNEPIKEKKKMGGMAELWQDFLHMPKMMLQLGICQFFSWFALFSMWVYFAPALKEHLSMGIGEATSTVGELFAVYNFIAMLFALLLIPIANKLGRKSTHAACLLAGGIGLMSIYFLTDTRLMYLSMVGVGMAWASILAMPYAILSNTLPQEKLGVYMGIFNFFITLPQIVNGLIHGWIVKYVYNEHSIYAILTAGLFLLLAAASVVFVKENNEPKKIIS